MARKLSSHLKLHVEDNAPENLSAAPSESPNLNIADLMNAFSAATGWSPRPTSGTPHHPIAPPVDDEQPLPPLRQRVRLVCNAPMDGMLDADASDAVTGEQEAWALLEQLDRLIQELKTAEQAIQRQEAQLATAVGVSLRNDEAELLADRLQDSLQRAAEQTGSDAAAIYLLDETTSELKMRSCVGLPASSLAQPARSLRGSLADLEALMGNAVLVENTALAPEWNCPEDFAAALCLPIGSPTMPQGTMWLWSSHVRDFQSSDVETAKSATDKILVDIERSVLADEVLKTRSLDRQLESASVVQASRLPGLQPLHLDYEIGGWTFQGQSLGGNFHTWTVNRQQQICAALGAAAGAGPAGALVATSVQTVVETCWNAPHKPSQVMRKANDILWDVEEGDWRSALCYLQLHPESGSTTLSLAGDIQAFIVGSRGFRMLQGTPTLLAEQPDTRFHNEQFVLEGGELLVVASAGVLAGTAHGGFSQQALLDLVRQMQDDAVTDISDHLARMLPMGAPEGEMLADRSLMIVRRQF